MIIDPASDAVGEIKKFYESRPDLPQSGTSTISISATSTTPAFTIEASTRSTTPPLKENLFSQGAANRTRLVAFPDFLSVQVSQQALGLSGTLSGNAIGLGAGQQSANSARISIPVAESYGLPMLDLIGVVSKSAGTTTRNITMTVCDLAAAESSNVANGIFKEGEGAFHVVREVFYARAIDVEIADQTARSMQVNLGGAGAKDSKDTDTEAKDSGSLTQQAMEKAMQTALESLGARTSIPGVTLSNSSARSGSISLRRVFDRPVAIGMRSFVVKPVKVEDPPGLARCNMQISTRSDGAGAGAASPAGGTAGNKKPPPSK